MSLVLLVSRDRLVSLVLLVSLVRRVSLVRLSELALPINQLASGSWGKEHNIGKQHTRIGVIVGIVIRAWVSVITLLVLVVPAPLQSQTQRKRTKDDSNGCKTTPFVFLFTAAATTMAGSRWSGPKPSTSIGSAAVIMRVTVVVSVVSLSPSDTQACAQGLQSSTATHTSAYQEQEGNTCNRTDDDTSDCTTAQSLVIRGRDTNCWRSVCMYRCLERLGGGCRAGLGSGGSTVAGALSRRRGCHRSPDGGTAGKTLAILTNRCRTAAGTPTFCFAYRGITAPRS